jgi:hypothetical protein
MGVDTVCTWKQKVRPFISQCHYFVEPCSYYVTGCDIRSLGRITSRYHGDVRHLLVLPVCLSGPRQQEFAVDFGVYKSHAVGHVSLARVTGRLIFGPARDEAVELSP